MGLNPFGVREVSKQRRHSQSLRILSLNPFGVREVSKRLTLYLKVYVKVLIPLESGKFLNQAPSCRRNQTVSLNPFGVREVSKP